VCRKGVRGGGFREELNRIYTSAYNVARRGGHKRMQYASEWVAQVIHYNTRAVHRGRNAMLLLRRVAEG